MVFLIAATQDCNISNASNAGQQWPHLKQRDISDFRKRDRARDHAVADNREHRRIHAPYLDRCARRELWQKLARLRMYVPHLKMIDTSAVPRLVAERTSVTFGTLRTACSMGAVTWSTICSAGRSPASMLRRTWAMLTLGNSVTGNESPATPPATTGSKRRNNNDRRCDAIQSVNMENLGIRRREYRLAHRHAVL